MRMLSAAIAFHTHSTMITATILISAIVALYLYLTRNFNYWKERGVKNEKPIPVFGTNFDGFLMRKSVTELLTETYKKYPNERIVGMFNATRPELLIRDPEIVKRIIQTDFADFYPRGLNRHRDAIEPLMQNLFFADGDLWRLLRQRMSPAFTSGKLKAMFPLIVERAEKLQLRTLQASAAGRALDARDLMARYTTDFIGACGFGLDADSLSDEDSEFRRLGVDIFRVTIRDALVIISKELFADTFKHLHILRKVEDRLAALVRSILAQRNYEPVGRNDFIDLLLECKKKGLIVGESLENVGKDGNPEKVSLEVSDELITAQIFVFFAAGFETSSSATSFTLHQLAFHPELQDKVQAELDAVLAKHNNKLSYEAVKEMKYLECAFKEGMRMFPSLGFLLRTSARPYTFADLNVSIDEGIRTLIPVQAIHNDPQYFENPEEFRPERFLPEVFDQEKYKYIYLPFGGGPRTCIGSRLGLMQSVAGLAAVLSRFHVRPAKETRRYPSVDPKSIIVQSIKGGLPLIFRERNIIYLNENY